MKILGIDTAAMYGSVAIVDDGQVLSECISEDKSSYARRLLGMIDKTLKSAHLAITDIEGFAVSSGPGSFTGIRIGISTAYGLSMPQDRPVAGISSLLAIASSFPNIEGYLCPVIDAKRKEVYAAFYKRKCGVLERVSEEMVIDPAELCLMIDRPVTFIGKDIEHYKGTIKETSRVPVCFADYAPVNSTAASMAITGLQRVKENGSMSDIKILSPNYIRRSEAEIRWEEKHNGNNKGTG